MVWLVLAVLPVTPVEAALRAGAASVTIDVPAGTPLAGYGTPARRLWFPDVLGRHPHAFWFRPSTGTRDPVVARALVLESGRARLAWVTVDLVAVDAAFTRDAAARLVTAGARPLTLMLSASHTHSGPGAYIDSAVMGWLTLDRAHSAVREALLEAVVTAVRRADAAAAPATMAVASVTGPPVVRSRFARGLDHEVIVLKITTPAGAPVAVVWNFAIHNTMLSARNLQLSGDVTGVTSALLERELGVPALFVNGAVGDVSPAQHGAAAMGEVGKALAATVREGWRTAAAVGGDRMEIRTQRVSFAPPRLSVRHCVDGWAPRFLTIPLGDTLPRAADLLGISVGGLAWVGVPGELQTALGEAIKKEGRALFGRAFVAGLSNDYLGYFVTAADYDRPHYVTCAAVFGRHAGDCLAEAAVGLLYSLRGRARPAAAAGAPSACEAAAAR
ncbi:MAG TPA: neutral/alkaline non-lysosomal ceramidase N-terminal domain-containing protein [Candidatus Limnocylindria bacterium]|nr:neutral/alkaline non-lysosomal ceramidase N-terminal domain-containing protein [Candidatus Limnocylindria bacterium]